MTTNPLALSLRAKKLGVLIRDARLASGKGLDECARLLGIPPEDFTAYELGDRSPSLPELELLAAFLNVPLDHFWGNVTKSDEGAEGSGIPREPLFRLRQRMIGALIRQARQDSGLSLETLSERAAIDVAQLKSYELGEAPVPLPVLETLAGALGRSVKAFQDQHGPLGARENRQRAAEDFLKLPLELQAFVSKPVNRPYLELAQRLSEMDVAKLRAVAEGLLEITL